jgi:hypothetical protein
VRLWTWDDETINGTYLIVKPAFLLQTPTATFRTAEVDKCKFVIAASH